MLFEGTPRFQVVRRLGVGGMGEVYEVIDRERNARLALKKLKMPSAEALVRFKKEFRSLEEVQHPNLVMLGELIEEAGEWFFTMELVDGVDFIQYVRDGSSRASESPSEDVTMEADVRGEPGKAPLVVPRRLESESDAQRGFDEARLRSSVAQLASAVAALHAAGKVHRDIKPANIIVTPQGRLALLDLGLVTEIERDVSLAQPTVAGTAGYMAPEQAASAPVGAEADWYSVGVLLFESLTGRLPFEGTPLEMMSNKQQERARPPSSFVHNVPGDLDLLCAELLRTQPDRRPDGTAILRRLHVTAEGSRPSTSGLSAPFVGRVDELAQLRQAYDDVRQGDGVVVLVEGESGVGKSALVQRFIATLTSGESNEGHQPVVLAGRCHQRESVPYKAFDDVVDALSRTLLRWERSKTEAVLPRWTALLAQIFPVLRRVEAIADSPRLEREPLEERERRDRVFAALRELFQRLSERVPLVLVIDDLQWADADSIALLREVLRPPESPRLLLVATVRTTTGDEADRVAPPGDVRRMKLTSLRKDLAQELAKLLIGMTKASADAEEISNEAEGHPLFISELVRYAVAHPGRSIAKVELEQALWSRMRQLAPPVRRLLAMTAVAGVPLRQDVAARAAEAKDFTEFSRWVAQLRTAHLVRTTGVRNNDYIEPYHDRVRAAVTTRIADELHAICHRRLAIALTSTEGADKEALAVHWHGAGDDERAAEYAMDAARQAMDALAFDRAARLLRMTCDLQPNLSGEPLAQLLGQLGDAVMNTGHGADAAVIFLEAAEHVHSLDALELRRKAAAELLRSGHIAEGLSTLDAVLKPIGMKLASTPKRALLSLLVTRARVRLRGLSFRECDERDVAAEKLIRSDACWGVGTGLALVDPIRAQDFQARHLLLSLKMGEPFRVARALIIEAGYRATSGGEGKKARALLERGQEIAERVGDPRAIAFGHLGHAIVAYLCGQWAEARPQSEIAEKILRERCAGMSWEMFNAQYFGYLSNFWLGRYSDFKAGVADVCVWADERGDLLAGTTARNGLSTLVHLLADEPDQAREQSREVVARLPDSFQLQHYWQLLAFASSALYEGDGQKACEFAVECWQKSGKAMLLRVQYLRVEVVWLLARSNLRAAKQASGSERVRLLKRAERALKGLVDTKRPYALGKASLVRAGIRYLRGDADAARDELASAIDIFRGADMAGLEAVAQWHLGRLLKGDEGAELAVRGEAYLADQEVARPDRFASLLVPAFADVS